MKTRLIWKIKITDEASAVIESGELSADDLVIIREWAELVAKHGPAALQKRPDIWNDHALERGRWVGYRASNFSYSGRIIYKVEDKIVTVIVVRITPDHEYR
jgi:mRNA-degrading endonuclease YafQ of YafQ-DinJ toxin-antitoxin module